MGNSLPALQQAEEQTVEVQEHCQIIGTSKVILQGLLFTIQSLR